MSIHNWLPQLMYVGEQGKNRPTPAPRAEQVGPSTILLPQYSENHSTTSSTDAPHRISYRDRRALDDLPVENRSSYVISYEDLEQAHPLSLLDG